MPLVLLSSDGLAYFERDIGDRIGTSGGELLLIVPWIKQRL